MHLYPPHMKESITMTKNNETTTETKKTKKMHSLYIGKDHADAMAQIADFAETNDVPINACIWSAIEAYNANPEVPEVATLSEAKNKRIAKAQKLLREAGLLK
jgi:hypothetical protein